MTWLLQPLDTDGFMQFKACLKRAYVDARADAEGGDVGVAAFLPCIYEAVRLKLQGRRWSPVFDRDGFGQSQAEVSPFIKMQLQMEGAPLQISDARPTSEHLKLCFPRRAAVPEAALFKPFDPPRRRLALASAPAPMALASLRAPDLGVPAGSSGGHASGAGQAVLPPRASGADPALAGPHLIVPGRTRSQSLLIQALAKAPPAPKGYRLTHPRGT
jgi:hypothetical protein